ncbi:MAG: 4a-hydroxytetrahydrobiopterin dehydratase [Armatimonadota bacterium]|nr:4a-hydroxytetrahydrobiopterin dehydratase [Armatimonadota bacterium]
MPTLSDVAILQHLEKLPDWARQDETLTRQFEFTDFSHAMEFVNQIAEEAESVNHHPDIDIRYNKVTLTLTTHDSGGITQNDVNLAVAADQAADAVSE